MATLDLSTETIQFLVTQMEDQIEALQVENRALGRNVNGLEQVVRDLSNEGLDLRADNSRLREQLRVANVNREAALEKRWELESRLAAYAVNDFDYSTLDGMDFIPAIKTLREQTGLGLKDAKETVERAWKDGKFKFKGGYVPQAYINDPEQWTDPKG